ncbi:hypothetical protein SRABI133_04074 [Peribacillus simplex]|uniref:DUF86 domain-containing protein n=2 Tax=Peribacillus simplex TaxID=1478 RepID=A0A9W4PHQ5_9BACI|nr:hypothetical protein SRABI133_04074 [Peribacillus simplex]
MGPFMENDVILNKISVIERCMNRVNVVYANNPENLKDIRNKIPSSLIQRACESSIDLAMHIVADQRLGLPQSSRDAFDMLKDHSVIDEDIARRLKAMVGFRNIAVHDYQDINLDILEQIIVNHLSDFTAFTKQNLNFQGMR